MSLLSLFFAQLCAGEREKSLTHHLQQRNAMYKLWTFERAHIQARDEWAMKSRSRLIYFFVLNKNASNCCSSDMAFYIMDAQRHKSVPAAIRCCCCNGNSVATNQTWTKVYFVFFIIIRKHQIYWLCAVCLGVYCLESPSKTFTVEIFCLFSFTMLLRPYLFWIQALK